MNIIKKSAFIKVGLVMLCVTFLAAFSTPALAVDIDDISLDDLPLPSRSLLPIDEQERAISFFESQHDSWLAVKSGSANCVTNVRNIVQGEFVADPNRSWAGTLEFVVTTIGNPIKFQSPAKIQIRLCNNKYKWNFVNGNIFDSEISPQLWADDTEFPIKGKTGRLARWGFKTELFFFPIDFMAKTYSDGIWDNRYTEPKEKFFMGCGVPIRHSTQEETDNIFGGEPQYLFMASLSLVDALYWFSAESGDLRQIDVFLPNGLVKSFRYENYIQEKDGYARFPQRFTLTSKQGSGDTATGWEYTVELYDVKLNIDIPNERFIRY